LHGVFGAIHYYEEGTFIAGGAGVTPFIAIFRQLEKENKLGNNTLIFSNNKEKDIIMKDEFSHMLGDRFINTLTKQKKSKHDNSMIDEKYLAEKIQDFSQYFYICGPDPMVEAVQVALISLGAAKEKVIIEQF
jgi:ferredoxin-NADP reductase